jgi:hypothetical protein
MHHSRVDAASPHDCIASSHRSDRRFPFTVSTRINPTTPMSDSEHDEDEQPRPPPLRAQRSPAEITEEEEKADEYKGQRDVWIDGVCMRVESVRT